MVREGATDQLIVKSLSNRWYCLGSDRANEPGETSDSTSDLRAHPQMRTDRPTMAE